MGHHIYQKSAAWQKIVSSDTTELHADINLLQPFEESNLIAIFTGQHKDCVKCCAQQEKHFCSFSFEKKLELKQLFGRIDSAGDLYIKKKTL